jgi:hypothetical protein
VDTAGQPVELHAGDDVERAGPGGRMEGVQGRPLLLGARDPVIDELVTDHLRAAAKDRSAKSWFSAVWPVVLTRQERPTRHPGLAGVTSGPRANNGLTIHGAAYQL